MVSSPTDVGLEPPLTEAESVASATPGGLTVTPHQSETPARQRRASGVGRSVTAARVDTARVVPVPDRAASARADFRRTADVAADERCQVVDPGCVVTPSRDQTNSDDKEPDDFVQRQLLLSTALCSYTGDQVGFVTPLGRDGRNRCEGHRIGQGGKGALRRWNQDGLTARVLPGSTPGARSTRRSRFGLGHFSGLEGID